ncbi:hypothetical protein KQX54_021063 [Cotesia glomerata]|uniref:Uncharacterized protein n=1 Tax=Cotesia glomerata TaxID=32391 RepID=A0AAV7J8Y0_COTGL|nr:hypothetical protein KQX54_021063 [Cotesia glomerata]
MSKLYRRQVQSEQEEAKGLDREPGRRKAEREDRTESSEPRGRATAAALLFSGTRGRNRGHVIKLAEPRAAILQSFGALL